jgi:hypothetical protein
LGVQADEVAAWDRLQDEIVFACADIANGGGTEQRAIADAEIVVDDEAAPGC